MYIFTATIIFVVIISIDLFAGGLSYGTAGIRFGFKKVLVINIMGKILIGSALVAGHFLGTVIPDVVGIWLGFAILMSLGLFKIAQTFLSRSNRVIKDVSFREAIILGIVLALDGVALSLGTAVSGLPFYFVFIVIGTMVITDQLVFMGSNKLGLAFAKKKKSPTSGGLNLDWLAGAILIVVAIIKLFLELYNII